MTTAGVGGHLAKRAELNPRLEAVVDVASGQRLTFAELDRRANRVASALRSLGLARGDRLAVLLPNCAEFVEVFYGAARAGLVVVPLNWRLVTDELAFVLSDAGVSAIVAGSDLAGVTAELHDRGDDLPVRSWVHVGERPPSWAIAYEDLLVGGSDDSVDAGAGGDDPLLILYTSGTTGHPKGAVHTHAGLEWSVLTVLATADLRFRDRYVICMPLFHVGALNPLAVLIYRGATAVLLRHFDGARMWTVLREERATVTQAVPAMLQAMLDARPASEDEREPLALRWIMSGASPVPPSLIEAYADIGLEVHQGYGLTETCGPACLISPDEALTRVGSTGKAFFHTEVRIVDSDGVDVGPGEPGEILVRAPHLMAGYWNRPDATAEVIRDGWLHTGDVAVRDVDGFVYIRDRIKDLIISGGENVYPAEIEAVLLTHAGVADVAVIAMPSARWGQSPLAVVVRADEDLDEAAVLAHCRGRLAGYKTPRRVMFTDAIPRNPTGKALKRVLRERFPLSAPE